MFRIFLLIAVLALIASPALADSVGDFSFIPILGDLGTSRTFTAGTFSLTANGFNGTLATNMWAKNEGPTEFGLGLATGVDREISNDDFVQLNLTPILALNPSAVSLGINSIQGSDSYNIWGSNTAGSLGVLLATNQTSSTFNLEPWAKTYDFFSVTSPQGSVLISALDVSTPEPGTLVLLIAGIFGVFYFGKKFVLSHQSTVSESR